MTIRTLLISTALTASMLGHAFAQETTVTAAPDAVEDVIVVKGTKLNRQKGIDAKREDARIIDALGVDELGQLPDKNIGESLNRLPGVTMLVEKGEGRYVQIRGINPSLNNVTINGLNLGSPETEEGGRLAPLDIISGGVLGAVEVVKTPTPDMDGQGIGGTVNVKTKSPFDRDEQHYGYATARAGFEEIEPRDEGFGGENPYALDLTLAGKAFDNKFGWLFAGSWSDREYIALGVFQDDWAENAPNGASIGGFAPVNVKNNYYVIGRERLNLNGVLEFRPSDNATYFARGFYGTWDEFQHRNRYEENFDSGVVFLTENSGTSGANRVAPNIRLENAEKVISSLALGGENRLDRLTLEYEASVGRNEIEEPFSFWEWRSGRIFGPNTWTLSDDGVFSITPDAGTPDRTDPALFPLRRARFQDSQMQEDTLGLRGDVTFEQSESLTLKAGAKARRTEREWEFSQVQFDPGTQALNLATADFTDGAFENCVEVGCAQNLFLDIDAMNAFIADPANAAFFRLNTATSFVNEFANDYDITETVYAGYGMATKQWDRLQVIGGVRIEATDVEASAFLRQGTEAVEVTSEGDYVNTLPALIVNFDVDKQLKLRGAVTRAIGRPEYDDIAPRSAFTDDAGSGRLSIGNPTLEPRQSWNYDAAIEWYPTDLSLLSVAAFYKDIDNELVGLSERFTAPADIAAQLAARGLEGAIDPASLTELNVTTTVNAGSSTLSGVEFNAQTQLDALLPRVLHGFGVSATTTLLDGQTEVNGETLPLLNQADVTYAFTGFYQNHGIDASVSYAFNGSYLTDVNLADPSANLDQGEFGRWDAKVSYEVNDDLKLFVEAANINDEPTSEFQGGRVERNTEYEYVGRTIYIGLSYGFGR